MRTGESTRSKSTRSGADDLVEVQHFGTVQRPQQQTVIARQGDRFGGKAVWLFPFHLAHRLFARNGQDARSSRQRQRAKRDQGQKQSKQEAE
jgi:hypothetical protein